MIETKPETIKPAIPPVTISIGTKKSSRPVESTRVKKVSQVLPVKGKPKKNKKAIKKKEKKGKPVNKKAELIIDERGKQMWKCAFCSKRFEKTV